LKVRTRAFDASLIGVVAMIRGVLAAAFVLVVFAGTAHAQVPDLSGKWSGYWQSETTGHTGQLHGRFRQLDAETYRVSFHGRFAKVVPFWYATKFHVAGAGDGVVQLSASQNLGLGLGTFTTTALATATSFDARYSARKDSGRFVLSRQSQR
jgi:hypothetical protein